MPTTPFQSGGHSQSPLVQFGWEAGVAFERAFARDHLVKNRAQAENVGVVVDVLPPHLLRRHVARRAHHRARLGGCRRGHGRALSRESRLADGSLGQSEVENSYAAVFRDEDVVGFKSRCTIPWSWAAASPRAISTAYSVTRRWESGPA